ncbi:MAG TPA: UDP-3-O-(3-hydroxymyristoyl)glucosamine N-acyltransferase [Saprospiraceae bacterium]|nr:UDP-3-O-(3-hydroxymyristoyl)glucosamine N-acyltransferase [Saprospiraceae bacterium]
MKFKTPIPVSEISRMIEAEMLGNTQQMATGINEIHKVTPGDIAFVDVVKYFKKTINSAATIIILNEKTECPPGKTLLLVDEPFTAYNYLVRQFMPFEAMVNSVSHLADIHPDAIIEPGAIIGQHVSIGVGTIIQANAVICSHSIVGKNCIIQPGAVIGSDAFYFKKNKQIYHKWNSCGRVIIEDDVYIGANCTINRGVSGDTTIGAGSKIDCLVHIGHGVVIGKNCLIAAQTGISGKTTLEDNVVLYGQVGIAQNINIGAGAVISAKSGISKDLDGGKTYFGVPASEMSEKLRELAAVRQLPELLKKMK